MIKVRRLEREIKDVGPNKLAAFRKWFQGHDAVQDEKGKP
jgi:hypothetical protein